MTGMGFITARGNLQGTDLVDREPKSTGGPPTQAPVPGKWVTKNLAYPTGVEQDPTQGHYIIFEIMRQNPGQLSAFRLSQTSIGKQALQAARLENDRIKSNTGLGFGGDFAVSRDNADPKQAALNATEVNRGKPPLKNSSIQMQNTSTTRMDTMIARYMPPSVQVSYNVKYADQEIGAFAETASAGIKAFMAKQGGNMDKLKATTDALTQGAAAGAARFGLNKLASLGGVTQGADALIAIERGQVITPRMELMFEGMGRREFSYSFTFIPKSEQEAEVIEKIVQTFKFHMAPDFSNEYTSGADGVREMTIPDHFNIRYMYKGKENDHLNKIATCALAKMDVDYGAERFTGYAGGRPQTTKISLSFTEFNIMSKSHIAAGA